MMMDAGRCITNQQPNAMRMTVKSLIESVAN
jgi:hypothetical protein